MSDENTFSANPKCPQCQGIGYIMGKRGAPHVGPLPIGMRSKRSGGTCVIPVEDMDWQDHQAPSLWIRKRWILSTSTEPPSPTCSDT